MENHQESTDDQSDFHGSLNLQLTLGPPSSLQSSPRPRSPPPPNPCSPLFLHPRPFECLLSLRQPFQSPNPPSPESLSLHSLSQSPPPPPEHSLSLHLPPQSPSPPSPQYPLSLHFSSQPSPPPPEQPLSLHMSLQSLPPPPELSLSFHPLPESPLPSPSPSPPPSPITQPTSPQTQNQLALLNPQAINEPRPRRRRTKADMTRINPPYPWSTDRRAVIQELEYLGSKNIVTIKGKVRCKKCERNYEIEYELMNKFDEIARFIEREKNSMHDRAPHCWENPNLLNCKFCNKEKCVEPEISQEDDTKINWLFLLLGQFLGCLKLKQLKYFCAQTNIHRTGAKNRLLYVTYLALCRQLQPFNRIFG